MKPKTPPNIWLLNKIAGYLTTKEGCSAQRTEYTESGARTYLYDAFGYCYEINIRITGRTITNRDSIDDGKPLLVRVG